MDELFYDFSANSLHGEKIPFINLLGRVVLVVNTASKSSFTPQYEGLQQLYKQYGPKKFVVLAFPCNQFGNQEPGGPDSIEKCLTSYGVTFPVFEKIDVIGASAHPFFKWLKNQMPGIGLDAIRENFTKFLISKDGTPLKRYSPAITPASLSGAIEDAMDM